MTGAHETCQQQSKGWPQKLSGSVWRPPRSRCSTWINGCTSIVMAGPDPATPIVMAGLDPATSIVMARPDPATSIVMAGLDLAIHVFTLCWQRNRGWPVQAHGCPVEFRAPWSGNQIP